jgi:hypothetical protein
VFDVNIISQIDIGGGVGNKPLKSLVVFYEWVIVKTNDTNVFSSSLNSVEDKNNPHSVGYFQKRIIISWLSLK